MDRVTVTVLVSGWWLPGRALQEGQTLELDAMTAEALARRGIVRLPEAAPDADAQPSVAQNAGRRARKKEDT
ncbi:MAG: hypothetical protein N2690_08995 [Rhodocyclaceae bacterium]|nr:hypothetical protein [Rhodocyclaceae bacterium]